MFGRREQAILRALAETMVPADSDGCPTTRVDVTASLERFLDGAPGALRLSTRAALWAVELSPVAWGLGIARFTALGPEAREACLSRWERAGHWTLRNLFFSLKVLVMGMIYDDPAVARGVCGAR